MASVSKMLKKSVSVPAPSRQTGRGIWMRQQVRSRFKEVIEEMGPKEARAFGRSHRSRSELISLNGKRWQEMAEDDF